MTMSMNVKVIRTDKSDEYAVTLIIHGKRTISSKVVSYENNKLKE